MLLKKYFRYFLMQNMTWASGMTHSVGVSGCCFRVSQEINSSWIVLWVLLQRLFQNIFYDGCLKFQTVVSIKMWRYYKTRQFTGCMRRRIGKEVPDNCKNYYSHFLISSVDESPFFSITRSPQFATKNVEHLLALSKKRERETLINRRHLNEYIPCSQDLHKDANLQQQVLYSWWGNSSPVKVSISSLIYRVCINDCLIKYFTYCTKWLHM